MIRKVFHIQPQGTVWERLDKFVYFLSIDGFAIRGHSHDLIFPLIDQIHQKTLTVLERVAQREGVPFLDVAGAFERIPITKRVVLFDDPRHPTEAGNELIAETVAKQIGSALRDDWVTQGEGLSALPSD